MAELEKFQNDFEKKLTKHIKDTTCKDFMPHLVDSMYQKGKANLFRKGFLIKLEEKIQKAIKNSTKRVKDNKGKLYNIILEKAIERQANIKDEPKEELEEIIPEDVQSEDPIFGSPIFDPTVLHKNLSP